MADYIVYIHPKDEKDASDRGQVIKVPPAVTGDDIRTLSRANKEAHRFSAPEDWVRTNILPNHPGRVVSLYREIARYEPATHRQVKGNDSD